MCVGSTNSVVRGGVGHLPDGGVQVSGAAYVPAPHNHSQHKQVCTIHNLFLPPS